MPELAKRALDIPNWQRNAELLLREYKKQKIDKGSSQPLQMFVGTLFAFNVLYSLPREMAHNQHEEDQRFRLKRH